jgi:hypothetical protein
MASNGIMMVQSVKVKAEIPQVLSKAWRWRKKMVMVDRNLGRSSGGILPKVDKLVKV